MQIIDIPIQQGQWLSTALQAQGYRYIPTNTIIDKTLPGLGATRLEIKAKRHSIIIEPNVPVILGKTKNKPELLDVWEKRTKTQIKNYLKNKNIPIKKLLTTPEGFKKIKEICTKLNIDIYNKFFCLFDECEKIVQDIDYRDSIIQPINDFFLFTNKALVSATPLYMTHPEFAKQSFRVFKVIPQYNYQKDLDLILTNNYEIEVTNKFAALKNSNCICVFLNKTDSIERLINTLGIKNDSKIFCSDKSVNKLRALGYNNAFDQMDLPLAKYNFFTCRFFSAVDIEIRQKPDIILLTNLNDAYHTMIDPLTEAIQIYGRFRNKYHKGQLPFNSLTHITNINPNMQVKTRKDIDKELIRMKKTYLYLQNELQNETDAMSKKTIENELAKVGFSDYLDENGNFNYFSLDNRYNEERVKSYYFDFKRLIKSYNQTGHFIVNLITHNHPLSGAFQSGSLKPKEKREHIVSELEKLEQYKAATPNFDINFYENIKILFRRQEITNRESGDLIADAFDYLGKSEIEKIGYSKPSKLKEATDRKKAEEKEINFFSIIQNEIRQHYTIGHPETKNDLKDFLQGVYDLNGIDIAVTQETIRKYCTVTSNNSANPPTYTIQGYN